MPPTSLKAIINNKSFGYDFTICIVVNFIINFLGITNAREAMKNLPEEDRAKIAQQVEVFRIEKRAFDNEVLDNSAIIDRERG